MSKKLKKSSNKLKTLVLIFIGMLFGGAVVIGLQFFGYSPLNISVTGVLRYQPPTNQSGDTRYPEGYYVKSRIYLEGDISNLVGRKISAVGSQGFKRSESGKIYPRLSRVSLGAAGS